MHQAPLGQHLREIADSKAEGSIRCKWLYKQFMHRIANHKERVLLTKMAEEAFKGQVVYRMGRSLPPKELMAEGIGFITTNEVVAYW